MRQQAAKWLMWISTYRASLRASLFCALRCVAPRPIAFCILLIPFRFDYTAISLANRSGLPLSRE